MTPSLSIVAASDPVPTPETIAERVRRLQAESKALAGDHVKELASAMVLLAELASDIASGGDAYGPGVRDLSRRLAEDLDSRVQILNSIQGRLA